MGLYTYFKINLSIVFISSCVYCTRDLILKNCLRTVMLLIFLEYGISGKRTLHLNQSDVQMDHTIIYFTIITLLDILLYEVYPFSTQSLRMFPIALFGYEIIFDFFHYWTHRLCHKVPFLYKYVHKTHHRHRHPSLLSTFYMHPVDYLLTNVLPHKIAMYMVYQWITGYEYELLLVYKMYIELAGHSGVVSNAPSFPLFPTLFGFALQTVDHDLHHSRPDLAGNYSKRFRVWDRVFGTYIRDSEPCMSQCVG